MAGDDERPLGRDFEWRWLAVSGGLGAPAGA